MLDAGHAYGSLAVSAARLGWSITLLPFLETNYVEQLLGISDSNKFVPSVERERGLLLGVVDTKGAISSIDSLPGNFAVLLATLSSLCLPRPCPPTNTENLMLI